MKIFIRKKYSGAFYWLILMFFGYAVMAGCLSDTSELEWPVIVHPDNPPGEEIHPPQNENNSNSCTMPPCPTGEAGESCRVASDCKSGICINNFCVDEESCEGDICCPTGLAICEEQCVNLDIDDDHCGQCGNSCPSNQECQDGGCFCDGTLCGNECVDVKTDERHCGQCHSDCTTQCVDGQCVVAPSQIAAGSWHTCVVLTDGTVKCWGKNKYGQLGIGEVEDDADDRMLPVLVAGLSNVSQLAAGERHTCALLNNGTVFCWGDNGYGQLGQGNTTSRSIPIPVPNLTDVIQITAGYLNTCALLSDRTIKCWGYNGSGQLGLGDQEHRWSPTLVPGLEDIAYIASGYFMTCAVSNNGSIRCWGGNSSGQLGLGDTQQRSNPTLVSRLSEEVVHIAGGGWHMCFLNSDGSVYCSGLNDNGQLGIGTLATQTTPIRVTGLSKTLKIIAGAAHTCALLTNGAVRCWGFNTYGQLGNSSYVDEKTPVSTSDLVNVLQLTAGEVHTCAMLTDHSVKCWGNNNKGQLGVDHTSTYDATVPILVRL